MLTNRLTRIIKSLPAKIIAGQVFLLVVASQIAPMVVDIAPHVAKISNDVKQATGAELKVKNGAVLRILPKPTITLSSVEITSSASEQEPVFSADIVQIGLDPLQLITGKFSPSSLAILGVSVAVEKSATEIYWGWLNAKSLKKIFGVKGASVSLEMQGGTFTITDKKTGEGVLFSELKAQGILSDNSVVNGGFIVDSKPVQYSFARTGNVGSTPFELHMFTDAENILSLKGSMDWTAELPVISGKLSLRSSDVLPWLPWQANQVASPPEDELAGAPLTLDAELVQQNEALTLQNMKISTLKSDATGEMKWFWDNSEQNSLNFEFDNFDFASWKALFQKLFMQTKVEDYSVRSAPTVVDKKQNPLIIHANAKKLAYDDKTLINATLDAIFADNAITVNQLNLNLPGDTQALLIGIFSNSETQGYRFEGSAEVKGNSLRDMLTIFDESALNLPDIGLNEFNLKSNLFISSAQLRLSEADAKFSELNLKGGLVAYFDAITRIESDVRLKDINFDFFRDQWRQKAAAEENITSNFFLRFDKNLKFDWLKRFNSTAEFNVEVDGFQFLERKGKNASFRLYAKQNELGFYNGKFNYPSDVTGLNVKLDVVGEQPRFDVVLNTKQLSNSYFAKRALVDDDFAPEILTDDTNSEAEVSPDVEMPKISAEEEFKAKIEEEQHMLDEAPPETIDETPPAEPASSDSPTEVTPEEPQTEQINEMKPLSLITSAFAQEENMDVVTPPPAEIAPQQVAPLPEAVIENSRFSKDLIDMSWMDGFSGNFDISVGMLKYNKIKLPNFKMLAKLERNLLSLQTLTFNYWNGSFSINGSLLGGKVPGVALGFVMASSDLKYALNTLFDVDAISGRVSLSGTVETSGINMLSWVQQARSKLLFSGRGVNIRGFDVASVLGAVNSARTAADVFNNVNMVLVQGTGEYAVDGALNIENGAIRTPGITMRTGKIAGSIVGDLRLIPWDIKLSSQFQFPELASDTVPVLAVQWEGPVNNPQIKTDTQSLEAFVSKSIIGD